MTCHTWVNDHVFPQTRSAYNPHLRFVFAVTPVVLIHLSTLGPAIKASLQRSICPAAVTHPSTARLVPAPAVAGCAAEDDSIAAAAWLA